MKKKSVSEKKRESKLRKKADFRTGKVQRDLRSCMICLLSFDPRVDVLSLPLSLPVPLFHSQETKTYMYTVPLTTH